MRRFGVVFVCVAALVWPLSTAVASTRTSSPFECTLRGGTKQVAKLLAQFSSDHVNGVRKLIVRPALGADGLELAPTFKAFAKGRSASYRSSLAVHTGSDLRTFMRAVAGHRFEVVGSRGNVGSSLQSGPHAWTAPAVSLEVAWRATGDDPSMNAHRYVSGSSKVLLACPSGRIHRALFSPNAYGPEPHW
jgi:hypothetical protein